MHSPFSHTSKMPFGRYKDKQMKDVPSIYLLWLYDNGCENASVKQYIIMEYPRLVKEAGNKRIKTYQKA